VVEAVVVAVDDARGEFGNPEEREHPPLEDWRPLSGNENEYVTVDISIYKRKL
jgi:hypothetical protein